MATMIKTAILTPRDFETPEDLTRTLVEYSEKGYTVTSLGPNPKTAILEIVMEKAINYPYYNE